MEAEIIDLQESGEYIKLTIDLNDEHHTIKVIKVKQEQVLKLFKGVAI